MKKGLGKYIPGIYYIYALSLESHIPGIYQVYTFGFHMTGIYLVYYTYMNQVVTWNTPGISQSTSGIPDVSQCH